VDYIGAGWIKKDGFGLDVRQNLGCGGWLQTSTDTTLADFLSAKRFLLPKKFRMA
jgi:hypothetical protein